MTLQIPRGTRIAQTSPVQRPKPDGIPVKVTAKLVYEESNECDNQPTLKAKVTLPGGKKVTVELRDPAWTSWTQVEALGGKTVKLEGRVKLNKDLIDMNSLEQDTPAGQANYTKVWDDLFKNQTHFLDTNQTEGVLVVDKLKSH